VTEPVEIDVVSLRKIDYRYVILVCGGVFAAALIMRLVVVLKNVIEDSASEHNRINHHVVSLDERLSAVERSIKWSVEDDVKVSSNDDSPEEKAV
jgi:hypothetical protein